MKKISILCALLLTTIVIFSCDTNTNETFDYWYTYIYSKNTKLQKSWLKKAYHDNTLTEIDFTVNKKSGLAGTSSGIIFGVTDFLSPAYKFVIDSNGNYKFCSMTFNSYYNSGYRLETHSETLISGGDSDLLKTGLGEKNTISIKLVANAGSYDIKIYANIVEGDPVAEYEIDYKGTGSYTQLSVNSLGNIYYTAYSSEDESSPAVPLNVQFTVPDDVTAAPATDYVYGWQDGTTGGADAGYRVFYCSDKKYYSTILTDPITGEADLNDLDPKEAIITLIKDSGAFNYGYGFSFCHDTVTDQGDTYYLFAIDTSGYYMIRKINTPQKDEDKQDIELKGWTANAKLHEGYGDANANVIVIKMSGSTNSRTFEFWINPADIQNPAGAADVTFTDGSGDADGDPFSTGTVKFYPGIGSSTLEDFPYNPVKYRFKYTVAN